MQVSSARAPSAPSSSAASVAVNTSPMKACRDIANPLPGFARPYQHPRAAVEAQRLRRATRLSILRRLVGERKRHSWQWWELIASIERPGAVVVRARATDLAGRSQPEGPEWNRLGYGNNGIQGVAVPRRQVSLSLLDRQCDVSCRSSSRSPATCDP